MHQPKKNHENSLMRQGVIALSLLILFSAFQPFFSKAMGEELPITENSEAYEKPSFVIMEDPDYFLLDIDEDEPTDWDAYYEAVANQEVEETPNDAEPQAEEAMAVEEPEPVHEEADSAYPIVTSVGRSNVKIHGVRSKNKLLEYTIPTELLEEDADFAALMLEAEKYIGFPYVYGASNPKDSFDCSGFVSWVFIHSGVYDTGRRGANGLYSLCSEVDPKDARPGDLIFFQGTMGADVDGITHVGIYVGNDRMIHAGDPIGFADLTEEKWIKRFYGYGRLPY